MHMKKITFKTGRFYDFEQEITAYSYNGRTIHFCDPSRSLHYSFDLYSKDTSQDDIELFDLDDWDKDTVITWYDSHPRHNEVHDRDEREKMSEFCKRNRKEYFQQKQA